MVSTARGVASGLATLISTVSAAAPPAAAAAGKGKDNAREAKASSPVSILVMEDP